MDEREPQWMQLDAIELRAIPHIGPGEYCYYYLERKSGGYSASVANSRIDNFKKPLDRFADRPEVLSYKWNEVNAFARDLSRLLTGELSHIISQYDVALVPMNTSRPHGDLYHDPRLVRLCERAAALTGNAIRPIDVMRSRVHVLSAHEGGTRDPEELRANLDFLGFGSHVPDVAILVDDVLTTGAHYSVCRDAIRERYPEVLVIGAFLSIHRSDYVDYQSYGIEYRG